MLSSASGFGLDVGLVRGRVARAVGEAGRVAHDVAHGDRPRRPRDSSAVRRRPCRRRPASTRTPADTRDSGSSSPNLPCSHSCISATPVTGLVIEKICAMASRVIGRFASRSAYARRAEVGLAAVLPDEHRHAGGAAVGHHRRQGAGDPVRHRPPPLAAAAVCAGKGAFAQSRQAASSAGVHKRRRGDGELSDRVVMTGRIGCAFCHTRRRDREAGVSVARGGFTSVRRTRQPLSRESGRVGVRDVRRHGHDDPVVPAVISDITFPPASSPLTLPAFVARAKRTRSDGVE